MAGLDRIWYSHQVKLTTKYKLYNTLVVPILLYRCDTWTLLVETVKRIQTFENKCLGKLLRMSCQKHQTNDYITLYKLMTYTHCYPSV